MMTYSNVLDLIILLDESSYSDTEGAEKVKEYRNSASGKLKKSASLLHREIDFLFSIFLSQGLSA